MERRRFIQGAALVGVGAGIGYAGIQMAGVSREIPQAPFDYKPGEPIPWINWAANQYCFPQNRYSPSSVEEVVDVMKNAKGPIRAVGSGHSFAAVVPTDQTLVSTDLMSGLVSSDAEKQQATVLGGTTLHDLGPLLHNAGQATITLPDMDYPTIAGAIATSTHGTGVDFGSLSSYVAGIKLVTPMGEVIECSADKNTDIFNAARTNVGSLGLIAEVTLQNQKPYNLTEVTKIAPINEVWERYDEYNKSNRHFEIFPLPHTDLCVTVATDYAKLGDENVGEEDPHAVNTLRSVFTATNWVPGIGQALYSKALTAAMDDSVEAVRTGLSYQVLAHLRVVRFREMEYTVPAEVGAECTQEILHTIKKKNLPLSFPLECRNIKRDDAWLSMFEGQDGYSISVHEYGDLQYKEVFAEIEPIFWKYGGRPHWGKLHTLRGKQLADLYPRHWQDFQDVRQALDPEMKMLTPYMKTLLGVS